MGILLDFSAYTDETADIRLEGGQVLHLRKPTEAMVLRMARLRDMDPNADPMLVLATMNAVALEILSNNADHVTFDIDTVAALDTDKKLSLLQAYTDWAVRLQTNPITASPQSRPEETSTTPEAARKGRRSRLREWFTRWRNTPG